MPTTKPSPKAPEIPDGEHFLTLASVEVREVDNLRAQKDVTAPKRVDKWLWRFVSDDVDPENPDVHYELAVWTFENYGHPKANLTKLLDMLLPRATIEQKASLNTDRLVGRRYKAQIIHRLNTKNEMQAEAAFIVPLREGDVGFAPPQPAGPPLPDTTGVSATDAPI